jgi:hypothetical protein
VGRPQLTIEESEAKLAEAKAKLDELKAVNRVELTEDEVTMLDRDIGKQERLVARLTPKEPVAPPLPPDPIRESREVLKQPLAPGMKFFESPEGHVIVAEAERAHVWCRTMNGGKGGWANPMR